MLGDAPDIRVWPGQLRASPKLRTIILGDSYITKGLQLKRQYFMHFDDVPGYWVEQKPMLERLLIQRWPTVLK